MRELMMKKQLLMLAICIGLSNEVIADDNQQGYIRNGLEKVCSAEDKLRGCDECFQNRTLRYGYTYELFYNYQNKSHSDHFIEDSSYTFHRGALINNKGMNNDIEYSNWIADKDYFIKPKEQGVMASIKNFSIDNIPSEGTKPNNLVVDYITDYQKVENGKPTGLNITHRTCQSYAISWCGDGILDKQYDEICDPEDSNKEGWGANGCDKRTCKPIDKTSITSQLFPNQQLNNGHQVSLISLINNQH